MAVGLDLADFIVMLSQLSISVRGVSFRLNCVDPFFLMKLCSLSLKKIKKKRKEKGLRWSSLSHVPRAA